MEQDKEKSFLEKVFIGLSFLGRTLKPITKEDFELIALVLTGHFDDELKCAIYHKFIQLNGGDETGVVNYDTPEVQEKLEEIKSILRARIQNTFKELHYQSEQQKRLDLIKLQVQHKQNKQPSEYGTVSEIAKRYNLSKSEIRRAKTEGRLEELIESQHNKNNS